MFNFVIVTEESKEMEELNMEIEMEQNMSNLVKNPSQKWSSNKNLSDRMIKLVEEIQNLNC